LCCKTSYGSIFLPATLIAGIFGMNTFADGWIDNVAGLSIALFIIALSVIWTSKKYEIDLSDFFKLPKKDNS
jgi:Mg2+ and Co2+ transporter CorA